jgi:hypothetical protein
LIHVLVRLMTLLALDLTSPRIPSPSCLQAHAALGNRTETADGGHR